MLVCPLKAPIDPLPGAYRREHLTRGSEKRLYFTKDEEAARQQRVSEPLEQGLLRLPLEVDDHVSAENHVYAGRGAAFL